MPSMVPGITAQLEDLKQIRDDAIRNMNRAQKMMALRNPKNKKFWAYQPGDQVWIEGTNLKTLYPSAKLAQNVMGCSRC